MVGKVMTAGDSGAQCLRIELADPAWREDRRLDVVRIEEFDQAPNSNPSAKLAFCQLQRGLVQDAPVEHGIKIGSEIYGYSGPVGPLQIVDEFVSLLICDPP